VGRLLELVRTVGWRRALQLTRGYRFAWQGILDGYFKTRIVQTLLNVGFFDALEREGSVEAASFAAAGGLDPGMLVSLSDGLVALGILDKTGTTYSLTPRGSLVPGVARGWFDLAYGYEDVFHSLDDLLTRRKEYGRDVFRRSEFVARGSGEIERWFTFPLAAEIVLGQGHRRILDLGCGDGTFLRQLCRRCPEALGLGVDVSPEAIGAGIARARREGLDGRIRLFVEDISRVETVSEALRGIDPATVFFVLQELLFDGADRVLDLLRSFRRLFPGTPLIVFEAIRPGLDELRKRPGMALYYSLYHDLTHQKTVGRSEWRELFAEAGFESVTERHLDFARISIFTLR
jgi:SAM-dependent methyltransferase